MRNWQPIHLHSAKRLQKLWRTWLAAMIAWLLLTELCTLSAAARTTANANATTPALQSIQVDTHEVTTGDTLTFTADVFTDGAGIRSLELWLAGSTGVAYPTPIRLLPSGGGDMYVQVSCHFVVPSDMKAGDWLVQHVDIEDTSGRRQTYFRADLGKSPSFDANLDFTVLAAAAVMPTARLGEGTALSRVHVKRGESVTVTLQLETSQALSSVQIWYSSLETTLKCILKKHANGRYTGELNTALLTAGISIWTPAIYAFTAQGVSFTVPLIEPYDQRLILTVEDPNENGTFPSIVSMLVDKTSLTVPDTLTITFVLSPADAAIDQLQCGVLFVPEDQVYDPAKEGANNRLLTVQPVYDKKTGRYQATVELPRTQAAGTLRIVHASLTTPDGRALRYLEPQAYALWKTESGGATKLGGCLPVSPVVTVNAAGTAVTKVPPYVERVRRAANGTTITIDCSQSTLVKAALFDALRGTSKTVMLTNGSYSWCFRGQDIDNPSRDVDIAIRPVFLSGHNDAEALLLSTMVRGQPAVTLDFFPNGLLPGKATVSLRLDALSSEAQAALSQQPLYAYYYNAETFELDDLHDRLSPAPNGTYTLEITHTSRYVLSVATALPLYVSAKSGGQSDGEGARLMNALQRQGAAALETAVTDETRNTATTTSTTDLTTGSSSAAAEIPDYIALWWLFPPLLLLALGALAVAALLNRQRLCAWWKHRRTPSARS